MTERPILFSGPMVLAIIAGTKTQTRRIVKNGDKADSFTELRTYKDGGLRAVFGIHDEPNAFGVKCPYGVVGDRLWVRETYYYDLLELPKVKPEDFPDHFYYRADGECCQQIPECSCAEVGKPRWRPSIFMPRWASRLTLEITDLRIERLNDISEEDAKAEGIEGRFHPEDSNCWTWKDYARSAKFKEDIFHYGSAVTPGSTFMGLWESINGPSSWAKNPWVWVIQFRKVKP